MMPTGNPLSQPIAGNGKPDLIARCVLAKRELDELDDEIESEEQSV